MEKQQLTAAAVLAAPSEFHNQRLEFLGDAVLEFVSTHHIFCCFPSYWEGDLTDARSSMVNNKVLGCFALRLGFDALLLHADADKDGVRFKDDVDKYLKLLADAFEAFMGAVYLDAGIGACRQLRRWMLLATEVRHRWEVCELQANSPSRLRGGKRHRVH